MRITVIKKKLQTMKLLIFGFIGWMTLQVFYMPYALAFLGVIFKFIRPSRHYVFNSKRSDKFWGQLSRKVLGMMKDENNGIPMTDYVGLRSKLYYTKILTTQEDIVMKRKLYEEKGYENDEIDGIIQNYGITKKAKGVKSSVVKTKITFEDYIDCLENFKNVNVAQNLIRSENHQVFSITQQKLALSAYDDKRYLIPGTYDTLPWRHYSIPQPDVMKVDTFLNSHYICLEQMCKLDIHMLQ